MLQPGIGENKENSIFVRNDNGSHEEDNDYKDNVSSCSLTIIRAQGKQGYIFYRDS